MAPSSKLLALALRCPLLRSYRLASSSLPPDPSRRLPGPFFSARFCSAAPAAVDGADSAVAAVSTGHPWPEWDDFLEKLRAKGYFERAVPASGADAAKAATVDGEAVAVAEDDSTASGEPYPFRELNRVKNACLKFGRERFDLLSSLPKHDIQAIVECGCPNIIRKAVNSAKRLREFVQVDEGDACSVCKLRGSCDKAYVIPKAEEGARTVDVVRTLLTFAIDPTSLSGENPVADSVQESARKLLSELIMLSDTTIDPSLPTPVFQTSSMQKPLAKRFDKGTQSITKSEGSAGKGRETTVFEMKKGDWLCPKCSFLNFSRNQRCLECKENGPKRVEAATTEMKTGDWICPQCHFMNFARNKICFKCEESRPKRQLNPGEWECPRCQFVNFRRNQLCKKCNHDCPEGDALHNQVRQNLRRNVEGADKSRSFDTVGHEGDSDEDAVDALPYEEESKHAEDRRAAWARRSFSRKSRSPDFVGQYDDDDNLSYEGEQKHVGDRSAAHARRSFAGKNRSPNLVGQDNYDALAYEGEHKHVGDRRATRARRSFAGKSRSPDFAGHTDDNAVAYEGEHNHVVDRRATQGPRSFSGQSTSNDFAGQDDDDVLSYEGERTHVGDRRVAPAWRSSAGKGRSPEFADQDDDDILPYEGKRKHVTTKRATPAQRRFTAARSQ